MEDVFCSAITGQAYTDEEAPGVSPGALVFRQRFARRSGLGRGRRGRGVAALHGLDHEAHLDRLGRDLDANDPAVNDGPDLLDIRLELPGGDAGRLATDAA